VKVLLTIAHDGDADVLTRDLVETAVAFVDGTEATRAAVDVRARPDELLSLAAADTERDASAVIALWDVDSPRAALSFPLPDGARLIGAYRVDEVVQKDYQRTWPSGETSPGVKLFCFVRRKGDITHDDYSKHWRENHGPLAVARQPGFWHYVQNHVAESLTDSTPDVDGLGELHYRSVEAVETETYDSEEGQQLIWDDTLRFMDHDRSTVLVTRETVVGG
jgi:uncharacterized protein (TIGR02118 family)